MQLSLVILALLLLVTTDLSQPEFGGIVQPVLFKLTFQVSVEGNAAIAYAKVGMTIGNPLAGVLPFKGTITANMFVFNPNDLTEEGTELAVEATSDVAYRKQSDAFLSNPPNPLDAVLRFTITSPRTSTAVPYQFFAAVPRPPQ